MSCRLSKSKIHLNSKKKKINKNVYVRAPSSITLNSQKVELKCLLVSEWISRTCCTQIMESYLTLRRNEALTHVNFVDEPWKHSVKADRHKRSHVFYDSAPIKCPQLASP